MRVGAGDDRARRLHWLTQRLEGLPREFRQLV